MKALLKRFFNLSMLWKFTITYFLLILAPTVIMGFNYYVRSIDAVLERSDKMSRQSISQIKQNILILMNKCEYVAEGFAYDSDLLDFLDSNFSYEDDNVDYLKKSIENKLTYIHNMDKYFYKIRIFTANSTIPEVSDYLYQMARIRGADYFNDITNAGSDQFWGKEKVAEEYFNTNNKSYQKVFPLYTPIISWVTKELIGVIEIDMRESDVIGSLQAVKLGTNGYYAIVDNDRKLLFTGNVALQRHLDADGLGNETGNFRYVDGGIRYRVVFDTIRQTGFKIMAVMPENELLRQVSGYRTILIAFIVLGSFGVFLLIYVITSLMFKRFRVMMKMMKRIQEGEFSARIDSGSQDEVGELALNFNHMAEKLEGMVSSLIEKETAKRDAEIKALQAQVNPHFLYNVLENLKMECEMREQYDISETITSLGGLYRYNMKWGQPYVTLRQELQHVTDYVMVMKARYKDRISFISEIPDELMEAQVIKMLLQPVVENCFRHAFPQKDGLWNIKVSGGIHENCLKIIVEDNGKGMDFDKLSYINGRLSSGDPFILVDEKDSGIGLFNINQRIRIQFGDGYGIHLASMEDAGMRVYISLPLQMGKQL